MVSYGKKNKWDARLRGHDGRLASSKLFLIISLFIFSATLALPAAAAQDDDDPRAYAHGIASASDDKNGFWIFFSSSGLPPRGEDANGDWTHDVYVAHWNGSEELLALKPFIAKPEAQEPVSVAQTNDGHIMVLLEDGWDSENEVDERYAIYAADLKPLRRYPQTAADGGHSGHVASTGNLFVVTYSEDWVEGGGVDDLGTGKGVYAKIYDSNGRQKRYIPIAPRKREWWPLVAASRHRALFLWQAYVKGKTYARLKFAMLDPQTGKLQKPQNLREVQYYTYAVAYLPGIDRFLVAGTARNGKGFAYLIDGDGTVVAKIDCMPPTIREAGITVLGDDAFTPAAENRLLRLHAAKNTLALTGITPSPIQWSTVGSIGLPDKQDGLHWFSLDKTGLQESDFDVKTFSAPMPHDLCVQP